MIKLLPGLLLLTVHVAYAQVTAPAAAVVASAPRTCEAMMTTHVSQPEVKFPPLFLLGASLRNFPSATIAVKWSGRQSAHALATGTGLASDLTERPVKYLSELIGTGRRGDIYVILAGTRDELLAEAKYLEEVHGGHYLAFTVLTSEGKNDRVRVVPISQLVVSLAEISAKSAALDPGMVAESGVAFYDEQSGDLYYAVPNDLAAQFSKGLLDKLRIKASSQNKLVWAEHRAKRQGGRYMIKLPNFTIVSPAAFRVLRDFTVSETARPHVRMASDFEAWLARSAATSLAERAAHVTPDAASIVAFFQADMPEIDPQEPGAALAYVTKLWDAKRGPLPKLGLLPNDIRLILANLSPPAEKRIVKAWAALIAHVD